MPDVVSGHLAKCEPTSTQYPVRVRERGVRPGDETSSNDVKVASPVGQATAGTMGSIGLTRPERWHITASRASADIGRAK